MNGKTLSNIQVLRAFACLNVVFFHIIGTAKSYGYPVIFFDFLEGWGSNGVDLFFVISGFIMVWVQNSRIKSPLQFIKDRLQRIVPVYWLLNLFLIILLFESSFFIFRNAVFSASSTFNSFFFLSSLLENKPPILYVGWTIEFEILFYLLFASSIFSKNLLKSITITSLLICLLILFLDANLIFLEFIFGMILGYLYITLKPSPKMGLVIFYTGLMSFLISIFFKSQNLNRVLIYGLPSTLIVFGCLYLNQIKSSFLTKLGDASYSTYLIQVFTIPAFYKLVTKLNFPTKYNDLVALCCLFASAFAGYFLYQIFEVKVSKFFKNPKKYSIPINFSQPPLNSDIMIKPDLKHFEPILGNENET